MPVSRGSPAAAHGGPGLALDVICARLGGRLTGGDARIVTGLAHPRGATPDELSFLPPGTLDYRGNAGAVLLEHALPLPAATAGILVASPLLACARAAAWLPVRAEFATPEDRNPPTIDPSAVLATGCVVEAGARVGAGSRIGAWTRIGRGARVGDHCEIGERVSIGEGVALGNRVRVDPGTVLGASPFVALRDGGQWVRFPAFAGVQVYDDVQIGANCTVARGAFRDTRLAERVQLDAQVHVGHDADIGADSICAGGTTIGGSTVLGTGCILAGRVAVADGLSIAPRVTVTAMSLVTRSIVEPATHWSGGWPVQRSNAWWRALAQWRRRVR